ncbi:MAG: chorismate pyruvate-lyase family protein [Gammaproteobacteria bacterium]
MKSSVTRFDPTAGLFLAQAQRPAHLVDVRPDELSALQRALLVIDGTVTTLLAAWALEPVRVTPLGQTTTTLPVSAQPKAGEWLEATAGTPVLERAVLLTGAHSGQFFAWAESVICLERLPPALRAGLLTGGLSLGQLLLLPGFESRRETLWFGRERPAALPAPVAALSDPEFLTRAYRVSAARQPLMMITERFPWRPRDAPAG